jgi:chromosome segregation ATPase
LPLIFKSAGSEEEAQEFVGLVRSIQEVQQRTGLSIDGLNNKVHALEGKAAELEPIMKKCDDCRKELAELAGQRKELTALLDRLKEKCDLLSPRVKDLEKREQDLLGRNKGLEAEVEKAELALSALKREKKSLADIGLSPEDLAELSREAQAIARRYKITSSELRNRLLRELKNLDQAMGLEIMIGELQADQKGQKQAAALAQQEADSLKEDIGNLKQERERLEASIKHTREEMAEEIAKIVPSAREAIDQWNKEMQAGHDEALVEVRRLRDETIGVGKEIGRFEHIVQTNQWLSDLMALVREDSSIEAKQVKIILLAVLRGAAAWLKRNEAHNMKFSPLPITLGNLINGVEQWQA